MKCLIQRVKHAHVEVEGQVVGQIDAGFLALVGFEPADNLQDYEWICRKLLKMRIFNDEHGVMNLSLLDISGELLVVSQFTLHASTKKGNRPSYSLSSPPDLAKQQYVDFLDCLKTQFEGKLETGIFAADMKVQLLNDGPVTIMIDSKNKV